MLDYVLATYPDIVRPNHVIHSMGGRVLDLDQRIGRSFRGSVANGFRLAIAAMRKVWRLPIWGMVGSADKPNDR